MSQAVIQLRTDPPLTLVKSGHRGSDLVDGLKSRSPSAERELVETYTSFVERVIFRIVGNDRDLDDLVQEVFIRAFERADQLYGEGVQPWLGAFAVNVAREALRKRRRRRWLVLLAPDSVPDSPTPSASQEVHAAMHALYRLMNQMDPDDQIAFALRMIDGREISEIAILCDTSPATAKRRIKRAEAWLRKRARRDARLADWVRLP